MTIKLAFAIVLMLDVGVPMTAPMSATTRTYEMPAGFETSEKCQTLAKAFNSQRGTWFFGREKTIYKGLEGKIVGAWCTVAREPIIKETK